DRQWIPAQRIDELGAIGDADELLRDGGDDLLARQGAPAALDHGEAASDFVGAVDVYGKVADFVEVEHRDAMVPQPVGGALRTGDRAGNPVPDLCQFVDEEVGGGTRTDA